MERIVVVVFYDFIYLTERDHISEAPSLLGGLIPLYVATYADANSRHQQGLMCPALHCSNPRSRLF